MKILSLNAVGLLVNDWRFSAIWTGRTGSPYTVGYSYQNGGGNALRKSDAPGVFLEAHGVGAFVVGGERPKDGAVS